MPGLVVVDHFITIMTTGVISVGTLATPVLTYINDKIIGSDKLFNNCCRLRELCYAVILAFVCIYYIVNLVVSLIITYDILTVYIYK